MLQKYHPHEARIKWLIANLEPYHRSISLRSIRLFCSELSKDGRLPAPDDATPMLDILDACEDARFRVSREEGGKEAVWARLKAGTACEAIVRKMYRGTETAVSANQLKHAVTAWMHKLGYRVAVSARHIHHYRSLESEPNFKVSPRLNMNLQHKATEYLAEDLKRIRVTALLECIQGEQS